MLSVYREFLPAAPRELYGFFAFATVPPADPFPAELHLRKVCGIVWHHRGSAEDAARAMAPLLDALPEPLLHGVQPMPHPAMQSAFDALYPEGDQWYWRADFVKEIPDAAVELHARFGAELPTIQSTMHLYPIDGAAHDPAPADTAWSYRDATWATVYVGVDPDPANAGRIRDWTVGYQEALHPYSAGGAYVNMMMDEGPDRVRASYRDNYDRLARIKAVYDPENTFRINQNIAPRKLTMRATRLLSGVLAGLVLAALPAALAEAQTPRCAVLALPCKLSVGLDDAQVLNPQRGAERRAGRLHAQDDQRPGRALQRTDPRRRPAGAAQPDR